MRHDAKIFALALAVPVIGAAIYVFGIILDAERGAMFSKIADGTKTYTIAQVEQLMGQPARIEQSEAADQTITGEVYHYPYHDHDMKIVFVNGTLFSAEFAPGVKS